MERGTHPVHNLSQTTPSCACTSSAGLSASLTYNTGLFHSLAAPAGPVLFTGRGQQRDVSCGLGNTSTPRGSTTSSTVPVSSLGICQFVLPSCRPGSHKTSRLDPAEVSDSSAVI